MISANDMCRYSVQASSVAMTTPLNIARLRTTSNTAFCCELSACAVRISSAVRPKRVRAPVALTTATASPRRTSAPENVCTPAAASIGTDSPVSIEWSSSTLPETIRMSAATTPPSDNLTTSPGTSSAAGMTDHTPSRRTEASSASLDFSAASVAWARLSCKSPSAALNTTSPAMIPASTYLPSTHSSTTAASSIQGTGAQNFSSAVRNRCAEVSGIAFGPDDASLARASALLRPPASGVPAAEAASVVATVVIDILPCRTILMQPHTGFRNADRKAKPHRHVKRRGLHGENRYGNCHSPHNARRVAASTEAYRLRPGLRTT